jgi:hypothetical protein
MTTNSDSFRNVTRYLGQDYRFAPSYLRPRDPLNGTDGTPFTSPDIRPKEQTGYYPIGSFWINTTQSNRIWVVTQYGLDANTQTCAHWELLESSGITGVEQFLLPDTNIITPRGIPPQIVFTQGTGIQITQGINNHTINIAATGVGGAITGVHPDAHTAPGTDPVLPDGSGNIKIEGGTTFTTGTQANPIRTNSLAANTIDLQIQLAGSNAAVSTANDFGVAQFDANMFTVTSGFVQVKNSGNTGVVTELIGDDSLAVVPAAGTGAITLDGVTVTNATHAKPVFFKKNATNTEELDVQVTTTSTSAAKNINNAGLASFDSTDFTVDSATGFVSLTGGASSAIQTLTGDTGGAVSPTGSPENINISGATTTFVTGNPGTHSLKTEVVSTLNTFLLGQGATTPSTTIGPLTNGQVIIGDTGTAPVAATLTAGSGISIANGPGSITISASSSALSWHVIAANQVGITNSGYICISPGGTLTVSLPTASSLGDIFEVVLDGATSWQITQGIGQQIRISSSQTTSGTGGSITTTANGDAIRLVCETANLRWVATSFTGNLTIA